MKKAARFTSTSSSKSGDAFLVAVLMVRRENSIETVTIYTSLYHYDAGKCGVVFPQQVLRKTSDYFKKCLDSGMIESSTGKIRMGDIELTTIQDFRIWLMTNSFRFFPDGFIYPYFADGGKQDINGRLIQLAFFGHRILCPALEHAAIKAFWDWQLWGELEDDGRPWDIEDLLREVYENTPERYILRRVMAFIATMHVFRLQEKQESAMGLFRKLGTHYGEFSADMFIARDILASKDHLSSLSWKGIALDFTWDNFKSNYLEREAWKVL